MIKRVMFAFGGLMASAILAGGCQTPGIRPAGTEVANFSDLAFDGLRRGTAYEALPSVRAQALESLQFAAPERGLPWIRLGLDDVHPGVRFAAAMALGSIRDEGSREKLTSLIHDPNRSVSAAAVFAMHRLGDTRHTHLLAQFLREPGDSALRGNTALILGRLGERGATKLLLQLLREEKDEGVRLQVLESLALLGHEDSVQQLSLLALSEGDKGAFVLGSLGELRDKKHAGLFRNVLASAQHLESKLIAARNLGRLDLDDGYTTAVNALTFNQPTPSRQDDPEWNQVTRIRQLAALALGAIGDARALPHLEKAMIQTDQDPRVQVAAARAILEIRR